jgi:hypothetical protein
MIHEQVKQPWFFHEAFLFLTLSNIKLFYYLGGQLCLLTMQIDYFWSGQDQREVISHVVDL